MNYRSLKRILSHFLIVPEHRFESKYSGLMDIRWEGGRLALNSPCANYSYNQLHEVMQKGLKQVMVDPLPSGKILNLGMGAGSTICILREEFHITAPIVSVEYDPEIISAAISFFDLERFKDHRYHCADAYEYMMNCKDHFALIIIDLFKDKVVDKRFLHEEFIDKCISSLTLEGRLLFNFIGEEHPATHLLNGQNCEEVLIGENRLLIYRKTDKS